YRWSGAIHRARDVLDQAEQGCDALESDQYDGLTDTEKGRAGYLCALVRSDLLENGPPIFSGEQVQRLRDDITTGQLSPLEDAERLYAEGRLYFQLPPAYGQSFKSSLIALSFLQRLRPEAQCDERALEAL